PVDQLCPLLKVDQQIGMLAAQCDDVLHGSPSTWCVDGLDDPANINNLVQQVGLQHGSSTRSLRA
ncbi:MAG: hypothetical protein ACRC9N_06100, partial [Aeromonas sp.]